MKKFLTFVLSLLFCFGIFSGCNKGGNDLETISIPDIVVDLASPENKVEVPSNEPSSVYDAQGRQLTSEEWLLNSKFAKTYIVKLGVGEYTFEYRSSTKKGTIALTITDDQRPKYIFSYDIPDVVIYLEQIELPTVIMDQDSYQSGAYIEYSLLKEDTRIEVAESENGYITPALDAGSYSWVASCQKNGVTYEYTQTFEVQTFDAWVETQREEFFFDEQKQEFVAYTENEGYIVDTSSNSGDFKYSIAHEIIRKAMSAGKTKATFTVITDVIIGGDNGTVWFTNGWKGYAVGFSNDKENYKDNSTGNPPYISSMEINGDSYIYKGTAFLLEAYFSENNPLELQFANGAKCTAAVSITFE